MASRWHWIAFVFSGLWLPTSVGDEPPVALLYPDVQGSYQNVFLNIADGVEEELGHPLKHWTVNKNSQGTDAANWLQENNIDAAILLGSQSVSLFQQPISLPFVVGAIGAQAPETYSAISLNPAPDLLFSGLRELWPNITTIHVVFDPDRNQWEVDQASALAQNMGITLLTYPTEDLRAAATTYRDIQADMKSSTEALWLPLGGPARDKSIMQSILEAAWIQEQAVFSSNLADVKRGALFAMYPNNVGMGKELGKLLREVRENPTREARTQFVTSLYKAVNRRTAEHLEIRLGNRELAQYEFVYPPR